MKKKMKNTLLSMLLTGAATTAVAATALIISPNVRSATAETQTTRFEMVDGASIRFSSPLGMRFIAELGEKEYTELQANDGTTRKMGMYIMPYEFIDTNTDGTIDVTDYASVATKLNYTFYANDGSAVDAALYEYVDDNGDTYYRANGVISNLKLQNYAREFVGIGYIAETKNGVTTYEYTDINYDDNVRTAAYVAIEAYADPDYADVGNAISAFTQYIDGAQLFSAHGVTQNENGKYVYNTAEYNTLAEIKGTIPNYAYGLSLDKSVKYVKEDGTAQLTATLSDTLNNVTFKGAHAVYSSSDESVVKVDKTGKLTHIKNGTATITATFMGKTQTCDVISGAVNFENGVVPTYMTKADATESLSVVDGGTDGNKMLQIKANGANPAMNTTVEFLASFFENSDVDYIAFDAKADKNNNVFRRDANKNGALEAVFYEENMTHNHPVDGVSYPVTGVRADGWKTFYFSRADYEFWVAQGKTAARFIETSGFASGENIYVDNIRPVTSAERAVSGYSFESVGVRVNDAGGVTLLFFMLDKGATWQFYMASAGFTNVGLTSENATDGNSALKFTKAAGNLSINLPSGKSPYSDIVTKTGYWAVDIYIPEDSDAKFTYQKTTWPGVTPKKGGWTTFYARNNLTSVVLTDTTGGTYLIDNMRSITEEEYKVATYSFEANAGGIRADGNNYMYFGGTDHDNNVYSLAFTGNRTSLTFSGEQVKDGSYSLKTTKESTGEAVNLVMRSDSEFYAAMKNGFSFWIYSDKKIEASNFCGSSGKALIESSINANEWTKITLTVEKLQAMGGSLAIKGDWTTIYLDGFQPLTDAD